MKGGIIAEATKYFRVFLNLIKIEVGYYSGTPPAPSNSYNPINFWIGEKTVQVECPLMILDRKSTRLNSSHVAISSTFTLSLHDALPISAHYMPIVPNEGWYYR